MIIVSIILWVITANTIRKGAPLWATLLCGAFAATCSFFAYWMSLT